MEASLNLAQLIERQTGGVDGNYPTAVGGLTLFRRSADPEYNPCPAYNFSFPERWVRPPVG
jgi:hypothetical protein